MHNRPSAREQSLKGFVQENPPSAKMPESLTPDQSKKEQALLLTVKEAMQLLRRGRARVYELCAMGEIETIRDGRSILIPREALDRWIEKKRRQSRH